MHIRADGYALAKFVNVLRLAGIGEAKVMNYAPLSYRITEIMGKEGIDKGKKEGYSIVVVLLHSCLSFASYEYDGSMDGWMD